MRRNVTRWVALVLMSAFGTSLVGQRTAAKSSETANDPHFGRCDVFAYLSLGVSGQQYLQDRFTSHGISFQPSTQFIADLEKAGAGSEVIAAARSAKRLSSNSKVECQPDVYAHAARAGEFKQAGEFSSAADEWRAALKLQPNNPMLHLGLAGALGLLRQWPDALREAQYAERIDPLLSAAHAQIGAAYTVMAYSGERDSRLKQAASHYQEAVRLSPGNCLLHTDYAVTLLSLRDYKIADQELASAQSSCPASTYTMYIRANWFADQGREKDAIRVLRLALERQPENCVVVIYLKGLLQKDGDAEGVREIEQKSKASCSGLDS